MDNLLDLGYELVANLDFTTTLKNDIVNAFKLLHNKCYMKHGDAHSYNIFHRKDRSVIFIDFSYAKVYKDSKTALENEYFDYDSSYVPDKWYKIKDSLKKIQQQQQKTK